MAIDSFSEIERRILRIEAALGISEGETPPVVPPRPEPLPAVRNESPAERSLGVVETPAPRTAPLPRPASNAQPGAAPTSGLFLAAIAGFCLLLAAVLMIRLAIESGWLTPARQVWITALFGSLCVATGFISSARDRRYLSILPGLGIAILNLAVYGAAFVHNLVEPTTAALAISVISLLCLGLYAALAEDLYIIYAALGTHAGAILLGGSATDPRTPLFLLVVWNLIFARLAVHAESRRLVSVLAYCGFATVYFVGHGANVVPAAYTQAILFAIYFFATLRFSGRHGRPLSASEAWALFPPLLVFYITEYSWLSTILGAITPYLFLGLAGLVWFAYVSAAKNMRAPLESGRLVYVFLAGTVLHAFFFQIVPDAAKPIVGLLISGAILLRRDRLDFGGDHLGLQLLAILTGLGGFLMALFDIGAHETRFAILNGVAYGVGLLYYALSDTGRKGETQIRDFAAVLAHLQWMTALYRAREFLGVIDTLSLVVTVLWVVYAFVVFGIGWTRRFAWVCRSCLFILAFCILKLMVYDVWSQPAIVRIVSLAGLGIALYVFGFLLRKVSTWSDA